MYSLRRDSPSRLKELGFLTCWQLQRQDGGASSPELSSYTWGKGGAGRGRARAFSLSHPNYCSLLGWQPALCAPPSLQSSRLSPHPDREEEAMEGWVGYTPGTGSPCRATGREEKEDKGVQKESRLGGREPSS